MGKRVITIGDCKKAAAERDRLKDKLISEHPDGVKYFIRFNYKEKGVL